MLDTLLLARIATVPVPLKFTQARHFSSVMPYPAMVVGLFLISVHFGGALIGMA